MRNIQVSGTDKTKKMKINRYIYVSYDIEDNKTRDSIARRLMFYGLNRVQYSVFRGEVSLKDSKLILKEFEDLNLGEEDSIQVIDLCEKCKGGIHIIGRQPKIIRHLIL